MKNTDKIEAVYDFMCSNADEDGFLSVSSETISNETGLPRRTVQTYLYELGESGHVHMIDRQPGSTTRWAITELALLD